MIGTVSKAFVTALRASNLIDKENVSVVLANDNGEGTVNTALPAVAVAVKGTERENGEFIGGMIDNEYIVQLAVISSFDNQAASEDDDHQFNQMDLAYKVMLYISACARGFIKTSSGEWVPLNFFQKLMEDHDFNVNYKGTETEQTRGMQNELAVEVFVTRLIYLCKFIDKSTAELPSAILDQIDLNCLCRNEYKYLNSEAGDRITTEDSEKILVPIPLKRYDRIIYDPNKAKTNG